MQAVILAAGQGLRLRPLTEKIPKGLVPILGKPLLEYTLHTLPSTVREVFIIVGYLGEQIQNYFGDFYNNIPIRYIHQKTLNGTGTALHLARPFLDNEPFLVLNGDDIYQAEDVQQLASSQSPAILVHAQALASGDPLLIDNARVTGVTKPEFTKPPYTVNCGAYLIDEDFFNYELAAIPVREHIEYSLPHTLLLMAGAKHISALYAHLWLPIGTPIQKDTAERKIQEQHIDFFA